MPPIQDGKRRGRIEVIVKDSGKRLPRWVIESALAIVYHDCRETFPLDARGRHRLLRELERLAPVARQQEEQRGLAPPLGDHLLDRRNVPN